MFLKTCSQEEPQWCKHMNLWKLIKSPYVSFDQEKRKVPGIMLDIHEVLYTSPIFYILNPKTNTNLYLGHHIHRSKCVDYGEIHLSLAPSSWVYEIHAGSSKSLLSSKTLRLENLCVSIFYMFRSEHLLTYLDWISSTKFVSCKYPWILHQSYEEIFQVGESLEPGTSVNMCWKDG